MEIFEKVMNVVGAILNSVVKLLEKYSPDAAVIVKGVADGIDDVVAEVTK